MRLTSSIRRRIVAILIGLFVATWLAAFGATYLAATSRIGEQFDAQLAHDAGALLVLAEQEPIPRGEQPRRIPVNPPQLRKVLAFAVWHGERLMLQSYNAPGVARPDTAGYSDATLDGRTWRGYTLMQPQGSLTVWVGEPFVLRDRMIDEITLDVLLPMLLALPLLAAAVWWGVGRGLMPLARVATEVAGRSASNLQPLHVAVVPAEVNVLVDRLNDLLTRLREAFERERRFTADAAHEIRTPLAGIKTHAQVLLRTANESERRQAAEQVIEGVDRTARLVEQLLTLARLDREALEHEFTPVDAGSLAAEVLEGMRRDAEAKRMTLGLQSQERAEINGNRVALSMMLRNLVDNAIRYTPAGGRVEVQVGCVDEQIALRVTDTGPGIPRAERGRIFDRFYRGTNASAFGCGLGLSIARRVAELHNASIALADGPAGRGLQVTVSLPRAVA
jgi:two-component system sensor histidine kinase QseC